MPPFAGRYYIQVHPVSGWNTALYTTRGQLAHGVHAVRPAAGVHAHLHTHLHFDPNSNAVGYSHPHSYSQPHIYPQPHSRRLPALRAERYPGYSLRVRWPMGL